MSIDFYSIESKIRNLIIDYKIYDNDKTTDILNYLYYCDCCSKHQINKPVLFYPWKETPFNFSDRTCTCKCRHLARMICRYHKDYI